MVSPALKWIWCILLTFSLGITLFDGKLQQNLTIISNITGWMVTQNLAVIAMVGLTFFALTKLSPVFSWSWLSFFRSQEDGVIDSKPQGENLNIMPMKIKYFGLIFTLLLIVNLPSLAMSEEKMFRSGTADWLDGLFISCLFGMTHCLAGVPIGVGIALTWGGLWFTHQYFSGGIELSMLHHTTYNLIIVSVLFLILIIKHIVEIKQKRAL